MTGLEYIQIRLADLGVVAVSVTLSPTAKDMPLQEVKMSVATFINSYLDGKTKPVALLDVEAVEDLAKRDGITLDEAKVKYDSVVLKTEPQPAVVRLKRKYIKKDKSISVAKSAVDIPVGENATVKTRIRIKTLLSPDKMWPFPLQIPPANKPEDALL